MLMIKLLRIKFKLTIRYLARRIWFLFSILRLAKQHSIIYFYQTATTFSSVTENFVFTKIKYDISRS